jgi:hypothetical protein
VESIEVHMKRKKRASRTPVTASITNDDSDSSTAGQIIGECNTCGHEVGVRA